MNKVNTFFNAFGDGKKTSSDKSFGGSMSSTPALDKLNKALKELISKLDKLVSKKIELEAILKKNRLRLDELPKLKRDVKSRYQGSVEEYKLKELREEEFGLKKTNTQLVDSVIPRLESDISEMKSQVLFSQKAVDAYRDSPVEQRDALLIEAEATLGVAKEELSSTIAKYESDIARNKKYLLIGLGVVVLGFLGYKFLK